MTTDAHDRTDATTQRRLFAVIPAAGQSRRMGRPKLLLPVAGQSVIARLLSALDHPAIAARMVVVRRDDAALRAEVERAGGWPISPEVDPPDMRTSVEYGLRQIEEHWSPSGNDGWLMLPADHPQLERSTIAQLVSVWLARAPQILLPTYRGRRGHPLIVSWQTVPVVRTLPANVGLNELLRVLSDHVVTAAVDHSGVVEDLDLPSDYERLMQIP